MHKIRFVLLTAALPTMIHAGMLDPPDVIYPKLPATAKSIEAFSPAGWKLEYVQRGDLDGDRRDDAVFVLRMQAAGNVLTNDGFGTKKFDTNPRILGVAFADGDGYRLVLQDHALIPRPDSPTMDDFLEDDSAIAVRRGALTVTLHAWSSAGTWFTGYTTYTFQYRQGCFRLIGYDGSSLHRASGESTDVSINYLTAKAAITQEGSDGNAVLKKQDLA